MSDDAEAHGSRISASAASDGAEAAVREPARVAAVRATGLLDAEAEEVFDRLSRLAVRLLGVPAAFLSLVDADRDFYLSACGFGEPLASARQITGPTFCHHALASPGPLVIPDTAADPAYRDVPTVRTLGVAAYVGVPVAVDGQRVGSFCAIDTRPRAWTALEVETMTELAGAAERELDLRMQRATLGAANHRLQAQQAELEVQAETLAGANANLEAALADAVRARRDADAARRQAGAAEAQLRSVFAQAPAAVSVTLGPEHRFVLVNPRATAITGRDDLVGRTYAEAFPELAAQGFAAVLDRVYATGEPYVADEALVTVHRPDGARVAGHYDFVYQPLRDAAGAVTGVLQHAVDVTARVAARAALAAADARFRAVQDASPDGSVVVESVRDDAGRIVDFASTYVNPAAERLTGRAAADLLGRRLLEQFPHVRDEGLFDAYVRVVETGQPYVAETEYRHDGMDHGLRLTVAKVGDGFHIHFADVSERLRAERRARFLGDLGAALQPLADPDALMATAARLLGEHLGADRCAYAEVEADEDTFTIIGDYTHGDTASIVGRFTFAAFGAEVLRLMRANAPYVVDDAWADPRVTAADRAAYAATQIRAVVCVPLHKAGRLAAAMAVHQRRPRRWAPDEVELVVTVVQRCWESLERARAYRDLAEREAALAAASAQLAERTAAAEQARRVAEDERRGAEEARRTAEEANAAKAQFLANMSHELRTPLNAIGGYVQLVELGVHGPVTDAQRGALARVQQAQRHLLGLITEILDYAKVEGGRVEYDVRPVDAREVVAAVAPLVEPLFRAKGLAYAVRLPDAPVLVWADRERLGQVLVNLLSNAAKFTAAKDVGADPGPAGGAGVVVEVSPGADAEADAVVVDVAERLAGPAGPDAGRPDAVFLRVRDTGRGIARDQQERVFEPFVQVGKRFAGDAPGTGLGLAISRDLARGMGGDLRVRSAAGEGSVFTVTLRRVVDVAGQPTERRLVDDRRGGTAEDAPGDAPGDSGTRRSPSRDAPAGRSAAPGGG